MTVSESKAETCALMMTFVRRSNSTTTAAIRKGNSLWRIYLMASLQAAQSVGNSGLLPTSSVYFQHRSHLIPSAAWISME